MEGNSAKESIVARLFGFGRRRQAAVTTTEETPPIGEPGFAKTPEGEQVLEARMEEEGDEPRITVPEQVIRVRAGRAKGKDEVVGAIGDSFRELTKLLGSVSDRLDRQDNRSADLSDQLRDIPEYLRQLPALHQEQNRAIQSIAERLGQANEAARDVANHLALVPEAQERTTHAVSSLAEKVGQNHEALQRVADSMQRLPEELRERAQAQEEAIRQVAVSQQQTAKVLHAGHNRSLQLFHQATQKTLQQVQKATRDQQEQMEALLEASVTNMKRMFVLAGAFLGAAIIALASLLWLR